MIDILQGMLYNWAAMVENLAYSIWIQLTAHSWIVNSLKQTFVASQGFKFPFFRLTTKTEKTGLYGPYLMKTCLWAYADMLKRVFGHMQTAKAQIRLRGCLHCPLTESFATTEYMNGQQNPLWYFMYDLKLQILHMFEGSFSLCWAHMILHWMQMS